MTAIFFLIIFLAYFVAYYCKKKLIFEDIYGISSYLSSLFPITVGYLLYVNNFNLIVVSIVFIFLSLIFLVMCFDKNYKILKLLMFSAVILSFFATLCIVLSLISESILFFRKVPITDFLFGAKWRPDDRIINGELVGLFGILPLLVGTLLITVISMFFAAPLGLFAAIYISEYANKKVRYIINTVLEILCGIPTIVYGYFAVVFLSPFIRNVAHFFGISAQSENALVAGIVIGIMILPFIISLMENAIRSVPKILKYGSMALGATSAETIWNIVLPFSLPALISAILLSVSRAIGETMIVLMSAGLTANLTFNPLQSVTTITVQIATLLTGDQDFNSIQTSSAYALGLVLFIITWLLNSCALFIVRRSQKNHISF